MDVNPYVYNFVLFNIIFQTALIPTNNIDTFSEKSILIYIYLNNVIAFMGVHGFIHEHP